MSWFGHTFMVVVQEIFWDRLWESDPKKAADIVRDSNGGEDVASFIEKMSPRAWLDACHMILSEEAD
jgi:hypothetical protein